MDIELSYCSQHVIDVTYLILNIILLAGYIVIAMATEVSCTRCVFHCF